MAGFGKLLTYSNVAGASAAPLGQWPAKSQLKRESAKATLVVFSHPHCPCSQATLSELERLLPKIINKVKIVSVFVELKGFGEEWAKDSLWRRSESLPGVTSVLDRDGKEAEIFGAKTSGQVFLFSAEGEVIFQGGITPARGHMGESSGHDAILAFFEKGEPSKANSPVFGCSLVRPERSIAGKAP